MNHGRAEGVNVRRTATVVGVVLLVGVCGAAAFVGGFGPFDDGGGEGPDGVPTATPSDRTDGPNEPDGGGDGADGSGEGNTGSAGSGGSGGGGDTGDGGGGTDGGESAGPPYTFSVTDVANCGRTCRDVTVELTNNRAQAAEDVVVHTQIFAGNTTESGARVWEGREDVGAMAPGETTTATKRVNLGFGAALSVQQNGGWITIRTTVQSADVTRTFTERRDVV